LAFLDHAKTCPKCNRDLTAFMLGPKVARRMDQRDLTAKLRQTHSKSQTVRLLMARTGVSRRTAYRRIERAEGG
jgi:hypothetical protein